MKGTTLGRSLSKRERQCLVLQARGLRTVDIAAWLAIDPRSVATYRNRVCEKLGLDSDAALAIYAYREGLVSWPLRRVGV